MTMVTELIERTAEPHSRTQLTKLVYAVLFLIVTSGLFYLLLMDILLPGYYDHLVDLNQSGLMRTLERHLPLAQSLFFLLQLMVVISFFPSFSQIFDFRSLLPLNRLFQNMMFGVGAGVAALLATILLLTTVPSLVGGYRPTDIVAYIADHFYSGSGLGLALLLVFVLPVAAEIFFRGILLRELLGSISVPSALILSTLLFVLSWPAFNWIAGAALGLGAGFLFYRTRSVLACTVANACFTAGAIAFQIARLR